MAGQADSVLAFDVFDNFANGTLDLKTRCLPEVVATLQLAWTNRMISLFILEYVGILKANCMFVCIYLY